MLKSKICIEIVRSTENGLSSISEKASLAIYSVLTKHYSTVRITVVNNLSDLESVASRKPDLVFLGMKFIPGSFALGLADPNKIWISEYLHKNGVAYTGSSEGAVAFELDKALAKQRILDAGFATPSFYIARQNNTSINNNYKDLLFPIFVKPISRGGGLGIDSGSIVYNHDQLQARVNLVAHDLKSDSLLEEYLPGREFSVAILKDEYSNDYSVMPIELIPPADEFGLRFLTRKVKKADTENSTYVADGVLKTKVCELAIGAFHALGARDFGRIDIRLDAKGDPHFLEANLLPSLTNNPGNYFPKACRLNTGMDYEAVILTIVRLALIRKLDEFENLPEPMAFGAVLIPYQATALEPI